MYGDNRQWRYIIGFLLVIVLLGLIIFMIVHHGNGGRPAQVPGAQRSLVSYASDDTAAVTETIVGPIVAPQNHTEINITVTNTSTIADAIVGYNGNVANSRTYPMTNAAFTEFLSALDKLKFTSGNTDSALANDQGYCPGGQRYIFTINDGSKRIQRFWATSCGGTKTYHGDLYRTVLLFQNQVPDYTMLTTNSGFSTNLNGL